MNRMLLTSSKARLPKGWSYPLGAETISAWLGSVEGASPRPIYFSDYWIRNLTHRQARTADDPYEILAVTYSRPYLSQDVEFCASTGQVDIWNVRVEPVPSTHRAIVRESLIGAVLPVVRDWLIASRGIDPNLGRGYARISYCEGLRELTIETRVNGFQTPTKSIVPIAPEGRGVRS